MIFSDWHIPSLIMVVTISILTTMLTMVYFKNRGQMGGRIAGALIIPCGVLALCYFATDYVKILVARDLVRAGSLLLFWIMIYTFSRLLKRVK